MQEFDSRLWRELQADERKGSAESTGRGSQKRGHAPWTVGAGAHTNPARPSRPSADD